MSNHIISLYVMIVCFGIVIFSISQIIDMSKLHTTTKELCSEK